MAAMAEPFDFLTYLADPMGTLAAARGGCPVLHAEGGASMVIGHDEVRTLLGDGRLVVNFVEALEGLGEVDLGGHRLRYGPGERSGSSYVDSTIITREGRFMR